MGWWDDQVALVAAGAIMAPFAGTIWVAMGSRIQLWNQFGQFGLHELAGGATVGLQLWEHQWAGLQLWEQ